MTYIRVVIQTSGTSGAVPMPLILFPGWAIFPENKALRPGSPYPRG